MGSPTIFKGTKTQLLTSAGLKLKNGTDVDIIVGTVDPSSSAVDAAKGSMYINTSSGTWYRKTDAGATTNWSSVGGGFTDHDTNAPTVTFHHYEATAHGGTTATTTWEARPLNTTTGNTANGSLATNVMTIEAGTYEVLGFSSCYAVGAFQSRLQNTTDASTELLGSDAEANGADTVGQSWIMGEITLAAQKDLEFQVWCEIGNSGDGFGKEANTTVGNIYAKISFTKID